MARLVTILMTRWLVPVVLVSILTGCASMGVDVRADNRDRSGQFDGNWQGTVTVEDGLQSFGHYEFRCEEILAGVYVKVTDGRIRGAISFQDLTVPFQTFIDSEGNFSTRITESELAELVWIMRGRLKKHSGFGTILFGVAGIPDGCHGQWNLRKHGKFPGANHLA